MSTEGATVFVELAKALARDFAAQDFAWEGDAFNERALASFRFQFESNPVYRRFCERRGASPDGTGHWSEVPCVPAMAFKHLDLRSVEGEPDAWFLTSGTTTDGARRGRHAVPDGSLYEASLLPPFRRYLVGGAPTVRMISLIPSGSVAPDSSLSFMVSAGAKAFGSSVAWVAEGSSIDIEAVESEIEAAIEAHEPVLWLGTSLAFLHLMDALGGRTLPSPVGSRIMETGGFKGADRSVDRATLHGRLVETLGVEAGLIIGEYGMTELLSQLYEPMLEVGAPGRGAYRPAPWLGVRAVDPVSLATLPDGEEGILAFFDLANLGSISAILTQDVGAIVGGSVHLRGRFPGSEPRGCSRAMDELLSVGAS